MVPNMNPREPNKSMYGWFIAKMLFFIRFTKTPVAASPEPKYMRLLLILLCTTGSKYPICFPIPWAVYLWLDSCDPLIIR